MSSETSLTESDPLSKTLLRISFEQHRVALLLKETETLDTIPSLDRLVRLWDHTSPEECVHVLGLAASALDFVTKEKNPGPVIPLLETIDWIVDRIPLSKERSPVARMLGSVMWNVMDFVQTRVRQKRIVEAGEWALVGEVLHNIHATGIASVDVVASCMHQYCEEECICQDKKVQICSQFFKVAGFIQRNTQTVLLREASGFAQQAILRLLQPSSYIPNSIHQISSMNPRFESWYDSYAITCQYLRAHMLRDFIVYLMLVRKGSEQESCFTCPFVIFLLRKICKEMVHTNFDGLDYDSDFSELLSCYFPADSVILTSRLCDAQLVIYAFRLLLYLCGDLTFKMAIYSYAKLLVIDLLSKVYDLVKRVAESLLTEIECTISNSNQSNQMKSSRQQRLCPPGHVDKNAIVLFLSTPKKSVTMTPYQRVSYHISSKEKSQKLNTMKENHVIARLTKVLSRTILKYTLKVYVSEWAKQSISNQMMLFDLIEKYGTSVKKSVIASNAITVLASVGFDLSFRDFSHMNLAGANLSHGRLQYANFSFTNLTGVKFLGADIRGSTFEYANLTNAAFTFFHTKDLPLSRFFYSCILENSISPTQKKVVVSLDSSLFLYQSEESLMHLILPPRSSRIRHMCTCVLSQNIECMALRLENGSVEFIRLSDYSLVTSSPSSDIIPSGPTCATFRKGLRINYASFSCSEDRNLIIPLHVPAESYARQISFPRTSLLPHGLQISFVAGLSESRKMFIYQNGGISTELSFYLHFRDEKASRNKPTKLQAYAIIKSISNRRDIPLSAYDLTTLITKCTNTITSCPDIENLKLSFQKRVVSMMNGISSIEDFENTPHAYNDILSYVHHLSLQGHTYLTKELLTREAVIYIFTNEYQSMKLQLILDILQCYIPSFLSILVDISIFPPNVHRSCPQRLMSTNSGNTAQVTQFNRSFPFLSDIFYIIGRCHEEGWSTSVDVYSALRYYEQGIMSYSIDSLERILFLSQRGCSSSQILLQNYILQLIKPDVLSADEKSQDEENNSSSKGDKRILEEQINGPHNRNTRLARNEALQYAQWYLADCLMNGWSCEKDVPLACHWRIRCLPCHYESFDILQANLKSNREDTLEVVETLFYMFEDDASDSGQSAYLLGQNYEFGICGSKDIPKAVSFYEKSISQGSSMSLRSMLRMAQRSETKDSVFSKIKALTENSHLPQSMRNEASRYLASCYLRGLGLFADLNKAIWFFLKAAADNDSIAMENLLKISDIASVDSFSALMGIWRQCKLESNMRMHLNKVLARCYRLGLGVERNPTQAIKLYVDIGNESVFREISECVFDDIVSNGIEIVQYFEGIAFDTSRPKSLRGFLMFTMGECYELGHPVEKNIQEAIKLYSQSICLQHKVGYVRMAQFIQEGQYYAFHSLRQLAHFQRDTFPKKVYLIVCRLIRMYVTKKCNCERQLRAFHLECEWFEKYGDVRMIHALEEEAKATNTNAVNILTDISNEKISRLNELGGSHTHQEVNMCIIQAHVSLARCFSHGWGVARNFDKCAEHILFISTHDFELALSEIKAIKAMGYKYEAEYMTKLMSRQHRPVVEDTESPLLRSKNPAGGSENGIKVQTPVRHPGALSVDSLKPVSDLQGLTSKKIVEVTEKLVNKANRIVAGIGNGDSAFDTGRYCRQHIGAKESQMSLSGNQDMAPSPPTTNGMVSVDNFITTSKSTATSVPSGSAHDFERRKRMNCNSKENVATKEPCREPSDEEVLDDNPSKPAKVQKVVPHSELNGDIEPPQKLARNAKETGVLGSCAAKRLVHEPPAFIYTTKDSVISEKLGRYSSTLGTTYVFAEDKGEIQSDSESHQTRSSYGSPRDSAIDSDAIHDFKDEKEEWFGISDFEEENHDGDYVADVE